MSPTNLLPCHRYLLQHNFYQLGSDSTLQQQLWVASMESAISAASHVSSGHHTPEGLQSFYSLPSRAHPCWSLFTASLPSRCPRQLPPCSPCQQTLLASFWISQQSHLPPVPPSQAHTTDFTETEFHLHWRRKWPTIIPGLVRPECVHLWTRVPNYGHFIALVRLLYLHVGKERQKLVCPNMYHLSTRLNRNRVIL